jgi:hypothetical protein
MQLLRVGEDLLGEVEQLSVLAILLLNRHPLLVSEGLPLRIGAVLTDHHESGEEIASSETIIVSSPNGYSSTPI